MSDLSTYLSKDVDIVISNETIAHIMLADDDLILFSGSPTGLQMQLNGLLRFCSNNKIIVTDRKPKLCVLALTNVSTCISTENSSNKWTNTNTLVFLFGQLTGWIKILFLIITELYGINLEKPQSIWTRNLNIYKIYHQGLGLICSIL